MAGILGVAVDSGVMGAGHVVGVSSNGPGTCVLAGIIGNDAVTGAFTANGLNGVLRAVVEMWVKLTGVMPHTRAKRRSMLLTGRRVRTCRKVELRLLRSSTLS